MPEEHMAKEALVVPTTTLKDAGFLSEGVQAGYQYNRIENLGQLLRLIKVTKYEGGQISFKTEAKSPIMHLTVGKMSFGAKKLSENIESMLKAVKKSNIANITLKSTMSRGIKIKI